MTFWGRLVFLRDGDVDVPDQLTVIACTRIYFTRKSQYQWFSSGNVVVIMEEAVVV